MGTVRLIHKAERWNGWKLLYLSFTSLSKDSIFIYFNLCISFFKDILFIYAFLFSNSLFFYAGPVSRIIFSIIKAKVSREVTDGQVVRAGVSVT